MTAFRKMWLVVAVALIIAPAMTLAQDPEDVGSGGTGGGRAITPLPGGFTIPVVELDFDLLPAGPVTVGDIQAAFPTADLANITLTVPTAAAGTYNTNACGRALGGDPAGGLSLFLMDPPAGAFGAIGDMIIEFNADTTQAGAQITDWLGPFNVEVFDNGASVGAFTFNTNDPPGSGFPFWFESTVPFDEMRLTANPQFPVANWVVCAIWVPEGGVPTLPKPAYGLLLLVLLGVSTFFLLRRRTA